jgi:hypothetical protein
VARSGSALKDEAVSHAAPALRNSKVAEILGDRRLWVAEGLREAVHPLHFQDRLPLTPEDARRYNR